MVRVGIGVLRYGIHQKGSIHRSLQPGFVKIKSKSYKHAKKNVVKLWDTYVTTGETGLRLYNCYAVVIIVNYSNKGYVN